MQVQEASRAHKFQFDHLPKIYEFGICSVQFHSLKNVQIKSMLNTRPQYTSLDVLSKKKHQKLGFVLENKIILIHMKSTYVLDNEQQVV